MSERNNKLIRMRIRKICDCCGKNGPLASTSEEAHEKAQDAGWSHLESFNVDYCNKCNNYWPF